MRFWVCCLASLLATVAVGQVFPRFGEERVGISTAVALRLLGSARSAALVGATTALPDGITVSPNPATAVELAAPYAVGVVFQRFVADIVHSSLAVGFRPWSAGMVVLTASALGLPPIEETTEYRPYGTGRQFRFGHWNAGIAYAHRFTDQFAAGATVRYVREQWAEATLEGLVWDAGTLYWTGIGSLRLAVAVSQFGLPLRARGSIAAVEPVGNRSADFREFAPPTVFRIGMAGELIQREDQRWTWMLSLEHPSDDVESYAVASEYVVRFSAAFPAELMVRAGLRARAAEWWGAGIGFRLPVPPVMWQLDYALAARAPVGLVHRLGLSIESFRLP
ncbi:MAG: hypothetical protein ABDH31_05300 [Chlorobiota bacterium]